MELASYSPNVHESIGLEACRVKDAILQVKVPAVSLWATRFWQEAIPAVAGRNDRSRYRCGGLHTTFTGLAGWSWEGHSHPESGENPVFPDV